ncbi:four-jointed box kinase [Arctopsyche grandis]|uniref:four-jointed box kinase n=1 Tax=Arctopsyche grandis TaxID=121162 RepID=UPI00406D9B44
MSKKDKNESMDGDNNQIDNECNKRTIKVLRQNMENSIEAGSSSALDNLNVGNCYRSILIEDDVDYKDLQIQMHAGQGFRVKNCSEETEEDTRRKAMFHRAYCRESFSRRFQKVNFDADSYALLNLMLGLKRKSSLVSYKHLCLISVLFAFALGLLLGIFIPFSYNYVTKDVKNLNSAQSDNVTLLLLNQSVNFTDLSTASSLNAALNTTYERTFLPYDSKSNFVDSIKTVRKKAANQRKKSIKLNRPKKFSSVSFVDDLEKMQTNDRQSFDAKKSDVLNMTDVDDNADNPIDEDNILYRNVFWGPKIEKALPAGFGSHSNHEWTDYMQKTSAIKMETGCGRMQNRLVTFLDGRQACVRYRQNTDQIQGELFSFYLAQLLNLPNLVPSLVSLVNLTDSLWQNVATDIGSAQWNSNRPVVMTKYISNIESAHIPEQFKPTERHLNKHDILRMIKRDTSGEETSKEDGFLLKKIAESLTYNNTINNGVEEAQNESANREAFFESISEKVGGDTLDRLVELAQWSDLIIFDYLTANLDRIVNNLYNYQWNVNIMDAPAHNLARKVDSNLLLFLDNESGLLHGYRLLHKYEIYHSLLLDNLCLFRKSTADAVQTLQKSSNVGDILNEMFKANNDMAVQDVLPPLPEKSVKILNERISRVASQIKKCQEQFAAR